PYPSPRFAGRGQTADVVRARACECRHLLALAPRSGERVRVRGARLRRCFFGRGPGLGRALAAAALQLALQELLRGVVPDVAVGLRIDQRLLQRAGLRGRDVLDAPAHTAEQRLAVVRVGGERGVQRLARLGLGAGDEMAERDPDLRAAAPA